MSYKIEDRLRWAMEAIEEALDKIEELKADKADLENELCDREAKIEALEAQLLELSPPGGPS